MKKYLLLLLVVPFMLAGCSKPEQTESAASTTGVTEYVTKPTEASAKIGDVKIKKNTASKSDEASQKSTQKATKATEATTESTALATQGATKPGRVIDVTIPRGSISASDFDFTYKGETVRLNDKYDEVVEKLGESGSEAELSKTKTEYGYDKFTIVTYRENDIERVESIAVEDESVPTAKGAKIGMYASRLRPIYGDPAAMSDEAYKYVSGTKQLRFEYENNIVTGYAYRLSH